MKIFEWQLCGKPIQGVWDKFRPNSEVHQFLTGGRKIPLRDAQHNLCFDSNPLYLSKAGIVEVYSILI